VPRIQNISLVGNSIPKESCDSFEVNEDFVQTKSLFAMLEAIEINSLDMLQCRLLLTIFEVGHAIYPAAYVSAGADVRAALALGADTVLYKQLGSCRLPDQVGEAQKNWQAIVMVDRYASLESDKGLSPLQSLLCESEGSQRVCIPRLSSILSPTVLKQTAGHTDGFVDKSSTSIPVIRTGVSPHLRGNVAPQVES
jgi:hypothetical protein